MTNTTGPAQQRDQPTQLTADEAKELDRLVEIVLRATWDDGFEQGSLTGSKEERAKVRAQANEAADALRRWEQTHGRAFWRADITPGEVTS